MKNTWINENQPALSDKTIVYTSMEMFIPELYETRDNALYDGAVDANFNGGLGILAGCSMEGFNAIGLNVCAITPLYSIRRIQQIGPDKGQIIQYQDIDYNIYKNLNPVIDEETNQQLTINIEAFNQKREIKVWSIKRSGIDVYMLECKDVFNKLYTGDRKQRLLQEIVIGKTVPKLLKKLKIKPDTLHLNESHTVLSVVHIKSCEILDKNDCFFSNTKIVFTIHTPRLAGLEVFYVDYKDLEIMEGYENIFDPKKRNVMDFTEAAYQLSDKVNTVSNNQIHIVKDRIFKNKNNSAKIIGILNGISKNFWMSERMKHILTLNEEQIDSFELWNIHQMDKNDVMESFSKMMKEQDIANKFNIDEKYLHLDLNKPSAWAIRRIVDYKKQWPMLKDIIRVICADRDISINTIFGDLKGLGMQVILGGMAHPDDKNSQDWIKEFTMWMMGKHRTELNQEYMDAPELIGNFFFLPSSYDGLGKILQMSAIGCDICLEFPLWNEEACGTSGMRALSNANPSIESSDGALEWLEDSVNGYKLMPHEPKKFLELLNNFSNIYYNFTENKDKIEDFQNDPLLILRKQAFLTWQKKADAIIMSKRYAKELYS